MAELHPYPFAALIRRAFRGLERDGAIFDLPAKKFVAGGAGRDYAVQLHGHRASSPLGPAAGPQTQMAQNIVLSWLGGSRIMELKTVQIIDTLEIPRPCIDMETIGFNVEWSQELRLQQSLEEYAKAAMLIRILQASGEIPLEEGFSDTIFDMSVGYDLAGITSAPVQAFIDGMLDASAVIERLRAEIPDEFAEYRDLDFPTRLSDTLTLSTFHGCPPDEIERIIDFLLREKGIHCVVKLNPTLLGPEELRRLLHDELGYDDIEVPESAFESDTKWHQVEAFVERLGATASELGLSFGVKFTNTLLTRNHRDFFPSDQREMYMSGPPLHVLAMHLVRRFRARFGDRFPISFSAGIDRKNFPDAVALGLTPITVCSDLCQPGGYGRLTSYYRELASRMDKVGAESVDELVLLAFGQAEPALRGLDLDADLEARCLSALAAGESPRAAAGDEVYARWVSAARLLNTERYVEGLAGSSRYGRPAHSKPPKKIGSTLTLWDCVTCDKCVPVCPNDANFRLHLSPMSLPITKATLGESGWILRDEGEVALQMKHQLANFADLCNECGNCDIFCPEDGGPYRLKPRFFSTHEQWARFPERDGFSFERDAEGALVALARVEGVETRARFSDAGVDYSGAGFELSLSLDDPAGTLRGRADGEVDLTWVFIIDALQRALLSGDTSNYIESLIA